MSLKIANRMYVVTSSGEREIQLCVGDITALPIEEKVDVIMVSAFPNNYTATSGSVLGALKRNLNLDVEELAHKHQKEDLRQNFNCWISKELPEHLPYRQLICFEKFRNPKTAHHLDVAVRDVFRAMMPVFNNENRSVITPLLATGSQIAQKSKMLRGMLNAAIEWMKFGLPLQLLRIVIHNESAETMQELRTIFDELKARAELDRRPPRDPSRCHDIFLIYSKDDEDIANEMRNFLTAAKKRFMKYLGPAKIITESDVASKKNSWNHDIIMAMIASTSVVPILTTAFMSDPACLDQYNLALCANRRTQRTLLAPFCLDSITDMPIYMTLVQWFNCRPRDSVKIQNSCVVLMEQMKESFETAKMEYDVFVSYCHKNTDKAKVFVNNLKQENSDMRIFFDQSELKTGQSWQQSLYQALDSAKCVIALVSNDYLESVVCNEELNVASAKHLSTAKSQELIIVQLEATKKIALFDYVAPISAEKNFNQVAEAVSTSVVNWLNSGTKDSTFSPVGYPMDVQDLTEKWRRQDLEANYFLSQDRIFLNNKSIDDATLHNSKFSEKSANDVFISYSLQDRRYANFLAWSLARSSSSFSICSLSSSEANDTAQIDTARCVIVLLSLHYHRNPKKIEEFGYILSRARKHRVIYVIFVDVLPTRPWYMRVVHCNTALTDDFWPDALASLTNASKDGTIFSPELNSAKTKIEKLHGPLLSREILALLKATCDIENICTAARNGKKPSIQTQKGIFFNIADLKRSTDVQNTRRREFTIVPEDYRRYDKGLDRNNEHNGSNKRSEPPKTYYERNKTVAQEQNDDVTIKPSAKSMRGESPEPKPRSNHPEQIDNKAHIQHDSQLQPKKNVSPEPVPRHPKQLDNTHIQQHDNQLQPKKNVSPEPVQKYPKQSDSTPIQQHDNHLQPKRNVSPEPVPKHPKQLDSTAIQQHDNQLQPKRNVSPEPVPKHPKQSDNTHFQQHDSQLQPKRNVSPELLERHQDETDDEAYRQPRNHSPNQRNSYPRDENDDVERFSPEQPDYEGHEDQHRPEPLDENDHDHHSPTSRSPYDPQPYNQQQQSRRDQNQDSRDHENYPEHSSPQQRYPRASDDNQKKKKSRVCTLL